MQQEVETHHMTERKDQPTGNGDRSHDLKLDLTHLNQNPIYKTLQLCKKVKNVHQKGGLLIKQNKITRQTSKTIPLHRPVTKYHQVPITRNKLNISVYSGDMPLSIFARQGKQTQTHKHTTPIHTAAGGMPAHIHAHTPAFSQT